MTFMVVPAVLGVAVLLALAVALTMALAGRKKDDD